MPLRRTIAAMTLAFVLGSPGAGKTKKSAPNSPTSLQQFLERVGGQPVATSSSLGSLWPSQGSVLTDLATDYKARRLNDVVIIRIVEQTLAQASGNVTGQRDFSSNSAITGLLGNRSTASVNPLYALNSGSSLKGTGTANSQSFLHATIAGRVVAVLPNGYFVVEAERQVSFNQQTQTIILRGMVRPGDIAGDDSVPSTSLSDLELEMKGKGVISDSVRQPNLFMRLLMKIANF